MAVLAKVASGVKRRIPAPKPSQPALNAHQNKPPPVPQAPDLRRWSDFMNPFPPVGPGGYTKYYKSRKGGAGGDLESQLQFQLPELCRLNYAIPPPPRSIPPVPPTRPQRPTVSTTTTTTTKTTTHPRSDKATNNLRHRKLSSIAESTSETTLAGSSESPATATASTTTACTPVRRSLRRQKRRLLRTPSIERDFGSHAGGLFASQTGTLDRSGSAFSSRTSSEEGGASSASSSSDDHSSPTSTDSDMPLTPRDEITVVVAGNEKKKKNRYGYHEGGGGAQGQLVAKKQVMVMVGGGYQGVRVDHGDDDDGEWEDLEPVYPFQRPDSRSTYRTARSEFSEL
ncbi:hypothetical protein CC1G_12483 [Coprinopsis cinerea okayama7|uniref:Uncharacterized protein n=1 Tax=Coprinopsis cinerea (strain Okayama-7 / 130 / ATCC MYA-4618 / FGSC 9003) TaxID=240176 RepID=A8NZZ8_COPC7|nr:hypothetical protein CC1G_12483 [Coprinopsis cinerea okayama7\|eukprot:XP_001837786.2 hypothetical protein CC1G_12483 [Coprinopsis cinerea okayama7\